MTRETKTVVVIGGGVVGCAILYHLARRGMTDTLLLERQELTSGSSWHAAGNLAALTLPANAAIFQKEAIGHYPELQEFSGQDCGLHVVGGVYLSRTGDQTHQLQRMDSHAKRSGVETKFISPEEAREVLPVLNTDGLDAILYEPLKGYCDPASVTNAYAKGARKMGAEVRRFEAVVKTEAQPDGTWDVHTAKGAVVNAQFVVNAAGLWGREVAALAGITLPLMPVEHHYFVTESIPEIEALPREIGHLSEPGGGYYLRQEGKGILLGIYEDTCTLWSEEGTPLDFGHELLPDDLTDTHHRVIERVMKTIPCLQTAGIKRVVNGPMIFSPDLGPLIGPHPQLKNYFCANGVMTGFNQGDGIGRILADWILDGEPGMDVHFWDVARFGDWVDGDYIKERARYGYENRQKVFYPFEEIDVAREKVTSAVYEKLIAKGAVHGAVFGMEHPLWYAPTGSEAKDRYDFKRGNWFDAVAGEVNAVRNNVGLIDVSSFAKYIVRGGGAHGWLDYILAGEIPVEDNKTALTPMLSPKGKIIGDFTVTRLAADFYLLLGSGIMQESHMRWFRENLQQDGSVEVVNRTLDYGGLHIVGPKSREFLQTLTNTPLDSKSFPFLSGREIAIGGIDVMAVRISFTGEHGYEIYCPREHHAELFDLVMEKGGDFGLKLAGGRAMGSMRMEKGFGSWGPDLSPDYTPRECGMARFVRGDKGKFIGSVAYGESLKTPPARKFCQMVVEMDGRDCFGGEAIYRNGAVVGYVTSAGFGHATGKSIALGYIDGGGSGDDFEIDFLGSMVKAKRIDTPLYDPKGERMRA